MSVPSWLGVRRHALLLRRAPCILTAALVACADSLGPVDVAEPQAWIYFVSTRATPSSTPGTVDGDIYRMGVDGSNVERLTTRSAAYRYLRLSPDGGRLAFYADLGTCFDIWTMELDGSGLTQLTGVAGNERCNETPEWSPDGARIAFTSSRAPERGWEALVMNADGSAVVDVGRNPSTDFATSYDGIDGWSPDGRVVVSSTRDGTQRTYLVTADGSSAELLFGTGAYLHPRWSPDGSRVVAVRDVSGNQEVFAMNADGSGAVNLSGDAAWDGTFRTGGNAWSPDGTRVAFYSRRTGNADVFVVRADGTELVDVTPAAGDDAFVGWSPDGTRILFSSDRSGDVELYLVDAAGGTPVNLTKAPWSADGPDALWVPRR